MSRLAKGLLGTALLGVGLQVVVLTGADHRLDAGLASNVLNICLAILATSAGLVAARVPERYARSFWRLFACGFALLTSAELLGAYYDSVLHADIHAVWPSDILYFLVPAPMALALFLRRRSRGAQSINWAQCFDFLQVGILTVAVYLYYFYLPSHWRASAQELEQLQWTVAIARDVFLILAFGFRLTFARSKLEWSLLPRLGTFLCLYCLGNTVFVHRQMTMGLDSGSLWDLCYTAPLVLAVVGACTWKMPVQKMCKKEDTSAVRLESWGSLWMSVLLPLVILGVASRLAHERPLLATMVVVVTLASSGSRSLLTHRHEQQTAQAMVAAEKKFRILFEDNPQPTCLYDPDTGRFLEVNRAATEKYGYPREEFLTLSIADVCPDLPPERIAAARHGIEIRGEVWRQRRKDGTFLEVIMFARTIEFEGRPARLVVTQDITERRRSERLQSALYRIAEVSTTAGDLTDMYPAIHGIVAHLLDAKNFYIALHEPETNSLTFPYFVDEFDLPPAPRPLRKGLTEYVLRSGEPLLATGERLHELAAAGEVERTGSPADDWLGVPLKSGDQTFGVLAVQHYASRTRFGARERDVLTFVSQQVANAIQRKRSEEALMRSESRYRSLVQSAVVGIFRATRDWRFLEVNPALAVMLGYGSSIEFLAAGQENIFVDPKAKSEVQIGFLRRGRFESVETHWRRKDSSVITVRLSGRGVRDEREGTEVFEVIVEDVTERKALEDQLRQAQKMEAVGKLAGGVAHDFNNLLTVITGYSQILMDQQSANAQATHSIEQIFRAADRATSLTRQLLAFSRRQMLQPRLVSLNTLVRNLERMLRPLLGERIQVIVRAANDLGVVRADPGQLEHILMNLAVNARDAMPRAGTLTVETANVELGEAFRRTNPGASPGQYVMLSVSDTGTGMNNHTLAHLFEPFFTTKEPGKGTGLGLSMVYGIVKQSGGYITVDSDLGRGSTFRIYLPRVNEVEEKPPVETPPATRKAGSGTILLVEDEDAVRSLVETILTSDGYQMLVASSPAQAIEIFRSFPGAIDVLLTDVVMPEVSGPELAENLLAMRPGLKVIYMSGYAGEHLDQEGVNAEGSSLLQKPFTAAALEEKIRQALGTAIPS